MLRPDGPASDGDSTNTDTLSGRWEEDNRSDLEIKAELSQRESKVCWRRRTLFNICGRDSVQKSCYKLDTGDGGGANIYALRPASTRPAHGK